MPTVTKGGKKKAFAYSPAGEKAAAGFAATAGGTLTKKKRAKKKKLPSSMKGM